MKRVLLGLVLPLVFALAACAPEGNGGSRPPRNGWRNQAAACTSDEQCNGGVCVMSDDAGARTRGTCSGPPGSGMGAEPALPPGHPGRRPGSPEEPTVKPQPGDIQL